MKRALLLFALLAACGSDRVAGTGSQTGNSIVAGRILTSDSLPVIAGTVTLRPAGWTSDSSIAKIRTVLTDATGKFQFTEVDSGLWRIDSDEDDSEAWGRTLRVFAGRDSTLPAAKLRLRGTLVAEVHFPTATLDTLRKGRLIVLETQISKPLDTTALGAPLAANAPEIYVTVPRLTAGTHWIILRRRDGTPVRQASVVIHPGKADTLRDSAWSRNVTGPHEDNDGDDDEIGDD